MTRCRLYTWAVLPLMVLVLVGCKKQKVASPKIPPPVNVAEAVARDVPFYLDEIGTCTAYEDVSIQPQASGQIVGRHFIDGSDLKQGAPLFTIDPRPYKAALDQAKADLAQTQAALKLAEELFAHARVLYPAKAVSKEDYQGKESSVESNRALILANRAAIETAQVNLEYCFINSPIDGRASKRQLDVGNIVTANSGTTLLVIQCMDPIYADFIITERDLDAVRRQMDAHVLQTQVRLPDEPEDRYREGDLTFLDNAVQAGTGTVSLRATLRNKDRHFWPGQFVKVRLVLDTLKDAVLVPSQATQISQSGPFVYVIRSDLTAELRPVKLGQRQGEMEVVLEGVKAGEKVVVNGHLTVIPGEKVRILAPEASSQAASLPASGPAAGGGGP